MKTLSLIEIVFEYIITNNFGKLRCAIKHACSKENQRNSIKKTKKKKKNCQF